jgi:hypothetical protein
MAICSILTENNIDVVDYNRESNIRLNKTNIVKNPFVGRIYTLDVIQQKDKLKLLNIIDMQPLYPNVSYYGFLIAFGVWFIFGYNIIVTLGILMGCLGIFWTSYIWALFYYIGLKKKGYNGYFKIISNSESLKLVLEG